MTIAEVRALLAKYAADNFHPPDLGDESDYLPTPRIEFRVSAAGGTLWLCDWPGGQSDLCYPVPDDSQLAAILDGSADVEMAERSHGRPTEFGDAAGREVDSAA